MMRIFTIDYQTIKDLKYIANILANSESDALSCLKKLVGVKKIH